jgi:hypothetical protein
MLDKYLNQERLPVSILNLTQLGLNFSFDPSHNDLPKSPSFELVLAELQQSDEQA